MVRSILLFVFSMFLICGCKDDLLGSGDPMDLEQNLVTLPSEASSTNIKVNGNT